MFFDRFKKRLASPSWCNRVSRWLNNLCGDGLVYIVKPENPTPTSPPSIHLDYDALTEKMDTDGLLGGANVQENTYDSTGTTSETLANAQTLAGYAPKSPSIVNETVTSSNTALAIANAKVARIGTSAKAAREDHVHPSELRCVTTTGLSSSQLTTLAGYAPKSPSLVGSSETDAKKVERMGTSTMAAREDHVHPIPRDTSTKTSFSSGVASGQAHTATSGMSLDSTTWDRDTATAGVKLKFYTRMAVTEGLNVTAAFREITIDKYGAIVSIGAEQWGPYMCLGA